LHASGALGARQLERLDEILADLGSRGLFRVLLIHYPVGVGVVAARRGLVDGEALRDVLGHRGAELILHGHAHRSLFTSVAGPSGEIPSVGVPSASDRGQRPTRRAQYHIYEIEPGADGGAARIRVRIRGLDTSTGRFSAEGERQL